MPRSRRYDSGSDSDRDYIPIVVAAGGHSDRGGRHRSPDILPNAYLGLPNQQRRRAASTSGSAQPLQINIQAPNERSRSRHRDHSRSSGSDRSRSRCGSRYHHDYRNEEERSRSRERRRRREQEKWEEDYEDRKRREKIKQDKLIQEAKDADKKKKEEAEELRKKILEDEENRKRKDKEKKEEEEKEFEKKVKDKFRAAGYSEEYIDDILHQKREKKREDREWAIDLTRPTFIKVNRKYLLPATLDHYNLPWEWDKKNTEYIIIKRYIDHDFQDELFEHTRKIKDRKLITTKEVVTLKPETDRMYLVREKSKSPSRSRRNSWMFT